MNIVRWLPHDKSSGGECTPPFKKNIFLQVKNAKPMIDNKPPETYMHLHLKLKKLQMEEERQATVERDNRILLEKMAHIMRTRGRVDNRNNYKQRRWVCKVSVFLVKQVNMELYNRMLALFWSWDLSYRCCSPLCN